MYLSFHGFYSSISSGIHHQDPGQDPNPGRGRETNQKTDIDPESVLTHQTNLGLGHHPGHIQDLGRKAHVVAVGLHLTHPAAVVVEDRHSEGEEDGHLLVGDLALPLTAGKFHCDNEIL